LNVMMNAATTTFDAHADGYDAVRRRLVPPFDAFYGTAVGALELVTGPVGHVLDLGAGTGLLTAQVLAAHPAAEVVLFDGAPAMLAQARATLGDERARYAEGDLAGPLPDGPWDAVVSALAIHHLEDAEKAALFTRVHDALRDGGIFVNAEQVAGPTAWLDALYEARHERAARALGATDEEWAGAQERMRHDLCATVEAQLGWLRDAGFTDADCPFKDHRFAVMAARRSA
jgi:tRNA (cmo5U34)-methyltransferase